MRRLRCRGVAAIEAALVMFATTSLLVVFVHCGRLALDCAAVDRAASGAARYLASVPLEILHDGAQRGIVLAAAQNMVDETLSAAGVDVSGLQVDFLCDPGPCATLAPASTPARVGVQVVIQFQDSLYPDSGPTQVSSYAEVNRDN
jgi:hypothetical protein